MTKTAEKPYPLGAPHTSLAHIKEYPQGGGGLNALPSFVSQGKFPRLLQLNFQARYPLMAHFTSSVAFPSHILKSDKPHGNKFSPGLSNRALISHENPLSLDCVGVERVKIYNGVEDTQKKKLFIREQKTFALRGHSTRYIFACEWNWNGRGRFNNGGFGGRAKTVGIYRRFHQEKRKILEETWRILTRISQGYRKGCVKPLLELEM